jgi:hypothetical protein
VKQEEGEQQEEAPFEAGEQQEEAPIEAREQQEAPSGSLISRLLPRDVKQEEEEEEQEYKQVPARMKQAVYQKFLDQQVFFLLIYLRSLGA